MLRKILGAVLLLILVLAGVAWWLSQVPVPEDVRYGATFSVHRANELQLDWKQTYDALIDDLDIKRFRLVAHWDLVEPERGKFNFKELDYQMRRAEEEGAEVILAVGRRLPSWPECHEPEWISTYSPEDQQQDVLEYITEVVNRYKDSPALKWWQVENEPFIIGFAIGECGALDIEFLEREVELVRELDPEHPVLLTASGELGLWNNTWERGDAFGTTLYRQVWNRDLDRFITYPTTPGFYRAKRKFTEITSGEKKPAILAELAAEPWVINAVVDTPLPEQFERMNRDILKRDLEFARQTSFPEQYLWGAEWWYYLKEVHNDPEIWEYTRQLFEE